MFGIMIVYDEIRALQYLRNIVDFEAYPASRVRLPRREMRWERAGAVSEGFCCRIGFISKEKRPFVSFQAKPSAAGAPIWPPPAPKGS